VSPMLRPLLPALVSTLGLLALASSLTACKQEYPACKKDKHCKAELGEKCVDKLCQECKADAECAGKGAGFVCKEFHCLDPKLAGNTGPGGGEIGDPCVAQPDCTGGWACNEGKCAMCTDDGQCAPSTCNVETGRCSNTGQCQTDDMCQMDEICDGGTCVFSGAAGGTTTGPCGLDAVYFGFDSDNVGDKQAEQLKALAACITQQNKNVVLEAHADGVGTEEYNILLTERRGTAVKQLLLDNGVPPALLQVISKGDLEAQAATEAERHKERRVQFRWP
jgi:flagellar motor protein MotB